MKLIDNVTFVKAWMTQNTVEQVAKKLDLSVTQASAKANNLRTKGVNLPRKKPNNCATVEDLNAIIESYNKGDRA